jgi:TRAP-type uncharacterized transport system substrate-binding protein
MRESLVMKTGLDTPIIFRVITAVATIAAGCFAASNSSFAQNNVKIVDAVADTQAQYREIINGNTITVMGSGITGSHIKIVDDISKAVNDGHKLRVLPLVGEGSAQNIRDILYLKGVDLGIVRLNTADSYEKEPLFADLRNRLQYITVLFGEDVHVIGSPNINTIQDLAGKRVAAHGGAGVPIQDLLNRLKIKPASFTEIDFWKALELIKNGELDAVTRITASPMKDFNDRFDPKYHKLIPVPFDKALIETHMPGQLTHKTYPKIIPEGETVETAAFAIVLAAYAWKSDTERYRRVAKFTEAFFSNMPKLLADKERHPGWDNVNLNATVVGWKRFPAAQEWLDKQKGATPKSAEAGKRTNALPTAAILEGGDSPKLRGQWAAFIQQYSNGPVPKEKMDGLYRAFLEWQQSENKQTAR